MKSEPRFARGGRLPGELPSTNGYGQGSGVHPGERRLDSRRTCRHSSAMTGWGGQMCRHPIPQREVGRLFSPESLAMRLVALVLLATAAFGQTYTASTFAGVGPPENLPGASVSLNQI